MLTDISHWPIDEAEAYRSGARHMQNAVNRCLVMLADAETDPMAQAAYVCAANRVAAIQIPEAPKRRPFGILGEG